MKCPACDHELTELQVGSLYVDVCQGGCGGIWFDAFELPRVENESVALEEPLLWIQRDEKVLVEPEAQARVPALRGDQAPSPFLQRATARRGGPVPELQWLLA